MWWRRLFLSHSLNARWKEAMFLSNLSECLPKNSLTSSMVFREKESEGVDGSSEKETEGQDGWSFHCFLTRDVLHLLLYSPGVWDPIFQVSREVTLFQDIAQGQPNYRRDWRPDSLVLLKPFPGTKSGLSGTTGTIREALVKKPWFLIRRASESIWHTVISISWSNWRIIIHYNEMSKKHNNRTGWVRPETKPGYHSARLQGTTFTLRSMWTLPPGIM